MRIVTTVSGYFDWVDLPPEVKVTPDDIASGKVKPGKDWTEAHPKWQGLKDYKVPTVNTSQITERDLVERVIGEYTKEGKQRRIVTRHQAVVEHIRYHTIGVARQFGEHHMVDVEVHDDGPSEALFDEVMAVHLATDHGKADGKNVDAEDAPKIKEAYMTPGPSFAFIDHGAKAQGLEKHPDNLTDDEGKPHKLAGTPHHGIHHARGVRTHILKAFRFGKK